MPLAAPRTPRHPYAPGQLGPTRVPGLAQHLGKALRRAREASHLSPMRLAARLHQGYTSVMALERGQHAITTDQLVRYCRAVGADPCEVLSDALAALEFTPTPEDDPTANPPTPERNRGDRQPI